MKELLGNAANYNLFKQNNKGEYVAYTEVILLISEPDFGLSNTGDLVKTRNVDTVRFIASAAGLRALAKQFTDMADECEKPLTDDELGTEQTS